MLAARAALGIRAIALHTLDRVLALRYLNDVEIRPLHVERLRIRILRSFFGRDISVSLISLAAL